MPSLPHVLGRAPSLTKLTTHIMRRHSSATELTSPYGQFHQFQEAAEKASNAAAMMHSQTVSPEAEATVMATRAYFFINSSNIPKVAAAAGQPGIAGTIKATTYSVSSAIDTFASGSTNAVESITDAIGFLLAGTGVFALGKAACDGRDEEEFVSSRASIAASPLERAEHEFVSSRASIAASPLEEDEYEVVSSRAFISASPLENALSKRATAIATGISNFMKRTDSTTEAAGVARVITEEDIFGTDSRPLVQETEAVHVVGEAAEYGSLVPTCCGSPNIVPC
jgi:hypothetical protein